METAEREVNRLAYGMASEAVLKIHEEVFPPSIQMVLASTSCYVLVFIMWIGCKIHKRFCM